MSASELFRTFVAATLGALLGMAFAPSKAPPPPPTCGKVLKVDGYRRGFNMEPGAWLAVQDDKGVVRQIEASGVWEAGMKACGEPR